ncbi:MAG: DNA/RNA helicase domain-containing protein, partial [[Clostridium] scindens]
ICYTQGAFYRGKNQLKRSWSGPKSSSSCFDQKQILRTEQYWENQMIEELERQAKKMDNYIVLKNQFRMQADIETIEWIRDFVDRQEIRPIPHDTKGYEINMELIRLRSCSEIPEPFCRIQVPVFRGSSPPLTGNILTRSRLITSRNTGEVAIGGWKMPWNKQIKTDRKAQKRNKKLSWAEQKHTIYEVEKLSLYDTGI